MAEHILYYVENDTLPSLNGVLKDSDGVVIDITSYVITLHINYEIPLVKTATITDAAKGEFQFTWDTGDLVVGIFDAEIQVIDDSDDIITAQRTAEQKRMQFVIREEII